MKRIHLCPFVLVPVMATAQTLCDSLLVESFTYDPFGNGLHIRLDNQSTQFLSYPYFDVLDDQGNTIVQGSFGFFGILPGTDQLHVLEIGGAPPPSPFTGSLVLHYTGPDGDATCTIPQQAVSLCPADSCFPFQVYALSQNAPVNAQLVWSLRDAGNSTLAGGGFTFTAGGSPEAVAQACLPPGEYSLHVEWPFPTGETFQVGVSPSVFEAVGPDTLLAQGGPVTLPFTLFGPCIAGTQAVPEAATPAHLIAVDARTVRITSTDGRAIGEVMIVDPAGRRVGGIRTTDAQATIELGAGAGGVHLLRITDAQDRTITQRIVIL